MKHDRCSSRHDIGFLDVLTWILVSAVCTMLGFMAVSGKQPSDSPCECKEVHADERL